MFGGVASAIQIITNGVVFAAAAWLAWRVSDVIALALTSAPNMIPGSINVSVIRLGTRLFVVLAVVVLLVIGAERVGVAVYGIIAGLGVGGLAIALAAQPTIENLLGSLSLFADRPVRVGDRCQ